MPYFVYNIICFILTARNFAIRFSFAELLYGLVDASCRKTGYRTDGSCRDRVRCRELRHASVHGYKAKHEPSAAADNRDVLVVQRSGFHARTNQIAQC